MGMMPLLRWPAPPIWREGWGPRTSWPASATASLFSARWPSYIQAHECEAASFEAFAALYPETTLLVDTYDTLDGVRKVIALSQKLGSGFRVRAVRLDSGDLGGLARETRAMLDQAGLPQVAIFASSSLDEYAIQKLVSSGAPIDAFGVGTKLAVLEDACHLDMAYKLVDYGGQGRLKLSANKLLYPGRKQVFRQCENGCMVRDVIARFDESLPGQPLLQPVMQAGAPVTRIELEESRRRFQGEIGRLPAHLRALEPSKIPYAVTFSQGLEQDLARIKIQLARSR